MENAVERDDLLDRLRAEWMAVAIAQPANLVLIREKREAYEKAGGKTAAVEDTSTRWHLIRSTIQTDE